MKPIRSALAGIAALGLAMSPPAVAATARGSSPSQSGEHLAGTPGNAWPAIIAILLVAVVSIIDASGHHHHHPASP